jgi:hypothetical protein
MQELRDDAIEVLRAMLRAPRDADRLRAAEAILRATGDATGATQGAGLAELSDQALLEIARGVHPREMGPVTPSAATVPSRTDADRFSEIAPRGTQNGPAIPDTPPPGLVTPGNPFLKRHPKGPKTDPPIAAPGAPPARELEPWE